MIKSLVVAIAAAFALTACATTPRDAASKAPQTAENTYSQDEIAKAAGDFFGTTSEAAGQAVARVFKEQGRPVGYIRGEEASGAFGIGVRYGKGALQLRNGATRDVFWQGPSIGFETQANASKVFILVYNLEDPDAIFQRFPGVSGSAYFVAGVGVNYQQAGSIVLAPMRAGIGLGAGVNVNYISFTRDRQVLPL
jgi:hypothetical protein